jgi:hypothetical protein
MIAPHFTRAQVYVPRSGEFSETASTSLWVRTGHWQTVEFHLPSAINPEGRLRLDPADARGIIEIAEMEILDPDTGETIWSATATIADGFSVRGTAVSIDSQGPLQLVSYGGDPIVVLPLVNDVRAGSLFRVRMRAQMGESAFWTFVHAAVNAGLALASNEARDLLAMTLISPERAAALFQSLHNNLCAKGQHISDLTEQLRRRAEELTASRADSNKYRDALQALDWELGRTQDTLNRQEARNEQLSREIQESEVERARILAELANASAEIHGLRSSWSWKFTKPLRFAAAAFLER